MRTVVLTSVTTLLMSCAYRLDPVPIAGSASAIGSLGADAGTRGASTEEP